MSVFLSVSCSWLAGLSSISVASVSHCLVNPLHWSLASLLIWGTISPADGSLLKHCKRSELIHIGPVPPPLPISLLSRPFFFRHFTVDARLLTEILTTGGVNLPALILTFLKIYTRCKRIAAYAHLKNKNGTMIRLSIFFKVPVCKIK